MLFPILILLLFLCPTAPSIVPIMHQISSTMNSFTLSWPQPEQPNGIILDYELRYYEKVRFVCECENAWIYMFIFDPTAICDTGVVSYCAHAEWTVCEASKKSQLSQISVSRVPWVDNMFFHCVHSVSPTVLWFLLLMKWIGWPLL